MGIDLREQMIDEALPSVSTGLSKYLWLQEELFRRNVGADSEYQRRFKGFYRVRRGPDWQRVFFRMLERGKTVTPTLADTLLELHAATGRVEASFASKLLATIAPNNPVIDSVVLANLGLALKSTGNIVQRVRHITALHQTMTSWFLEFLDSAAGRYLVRRFQQEYPAAQVTEIKMLDLVLWQSR